MQPVLTESKGCFLSYLCAFRHQKRNQFYVISSNRAASGDTSCLVCKCNTMNHSHARKHAHIHTLARQQIIDILASRTHRSQGSRWCLFSLYSILPSHAPLMGAVSVLICVSCQRAACLVKSGNRKASGDGAEVEAAERAAESRPGTTDILLHPPGQLFDKHSTFGPTCPGVIPLSADHKCQ